MRVLGICLSHRKDGNSEILLSAYELGRLVSLMISQGFKYPEGYDRPIYTMVRQKYGIHQSPYENE